MSAESVYKYYDRVNYKKEKREHELKCGGYLSVLCVMPDCARICCSNCGTWVIYGEGRGKYLVCDTCMERGFL